MFTNEQRTILSQASDTWGLELAALLAVIEVESAGRITEIVDGRPEPLIRWEGHYFDRLVPPRLQSIARSAGLANPKAGAVKNPKSQAGRYAMLWRAMGLDSAAAISSASWGIGQVMGSHWKWLGYADPEEFMSRVRGSFEGQVEVMLRYIDKAGLIDELKRRDWSAFARGYNGPAYAQQGYHKKIAAAYARYAQPNAPEVRKPSTGMLRMGSKGAQVRELQTLLRRGGYAVNVDGDFGPSTKRAVEAFQTATGLTADGVVGPQTMAELTRLRVEPEEPVGVQKLTDLEETKIGGGAAISGVGLTSAADQVQQVAGNLPGGSVIIESVSSTLYIVAAVLVLCGLGYAAYGYIRSKRTVEAPA
jgi:hypothetical protein